jgi:hypothetical protein
MRRARAFSCFFICGLFILLVALNALFTKWKSKTQVLLLFQKESIERPTRPRPRPRRPRPRPRILSCSQFTCNILAHQRGFSDVIDVGVVFWIGVLTRRWLGGGEQGDFCAAYQRIRHSLIEREHSGMVARIFQFLMLYLLVVV